LEKQRFAKEEVSLRMRRFDNYVSLLAAALAKLLEIVLKIVLAHFLLFFRASDFPSNSGRRIRNASLQCRVQRWTSHEFNSRGPGTLRLQRRFEDSWDSPNSTLQILTPDTDNCQTGPPVETSFSFGGPGADEHVSPSIAALPNGGFAVAGCWSADERDCRGMPLADWPGFLAQYNADGQEVWRIDFVQQVPMTEESYTAATGLEVDSDGNVYVVGKFNGTVDFGGTQLTSVGYDSSHGVRHVGMPHMLPSTARPVL